MRQLLKFFLFTLFVNNVYAEDMIDPSLISPVECLTPVVRLEPKIVPIINFGYQYKETNYSIDTVHVNTYTLVDVDGVMYKKYMIFSNNKWEDVLVKK